MLRFKFSDVVLLIFTLYAMNHYIFERLFFFNEILSLIGLVYLLHFSFRKKGKLFLPESKLYRLILILIGLFLVYSIGSLFIKTNWYFYFRNFSIVYSVFPFFIGFYLYHQQKRFFEKSKAIIYGYSLTSFAIGSELLIDRSAYGFWFALLQKNWGILGILFFSALFFLYVFAFTSMTTVLIYLIVMYFIALKSYRLLKVSMLLGFLGVTTIMVLAIDHLELYKFGRYNFFGNVELIYEQHPFFNIDHNSSWRLLFWYRLMVEQFPENLLGVGIGTPLLPYKEFRMSTSLGHSDQYIAHVIGAHNTFITLFARFGLGCLILIGIIYRTVFREFYRFRTYYFDKRNDFSIFLAFFTISVVGIFNLLLETPTLAAVYWVLLGFVARAIYERKQKQYAV